MSSQFLDDEMKELLDSFIVETREILDNLDQDLIILESKPQDLELLNSIFRSFHTIKGTSSFMGFEQITTITHQAEDLLNKLRRSELKINTEIMDVLLEVYDWMKVLCGIIESGSNETVDYSATIEKLHRINSPVAEQKPASNKASVKATKQKENHGAENHGAVDSILSNSSFGKGEGDFSDDELAMLEQAFKEINQNFANADSPNESTPTDISSEEAIAEPPILSQKSDEPVVPAPITTKQLQEEKNPPPAAEAGTRVVADNTIRVDVNRLEMLMDLSGELVLGRNRLAQITYDLAQVFENNDYVRELQETSSQINFITTELQSAIMKTRMVPIAKLFQKAPRMVRDLSKEFGKDIELVLRGEDTELDRSIIEELNDPLVHMIRNSCDHGVESPEVREKTGKNRKGTLILEAEHEGNHIVIKITDDGKGMDPAILKSKAIDKGVITQEQASLMSEREIFNLIFAPGFSTAEKVTNVSGRGVGMDVVRTNIQKLKGIIEIESTIGKGTTLTIKLPLTLAIIQGLLVRTHQEIYALPLSSVIEVVSTDLNQIFTVNQNEVIKIRNQVFPLIRMDKTLKTKTITEALENRYVVVVGLADYRLGLVVDELLGQKEIVIKSLGDYLGQITGIAGSTILGDGRVIMIIDIVELMRNSYPGMVNNA